MEIKLSNVSFSYDNKVVFNDFSCLFKSNMINAIVGRSGCGKSTLLDILAGLKNCSKGNVFIDGNDVSLYRKKIGYIFQSPEEQFFNSNVFNEVSFALKCYGEKDINKKVSNALNLVGLDDSYYNFDPFRLSNGEKRRIAIASILSYDPDIIIMDEPTVGLDTCSCDNLIKLIKTLKNEYKKTIIIVSHDIDFLHKFVDYVYLIKDGKLVLDGNKYDVFGNEDAMNGAGLVVPRLLHFSNIVFRNKNIKIGYRDEINDLIKDVYRYVE